MTRASLSQEVRLALPTDLAQIARFLIRLGGKSFGERFPVGTAEDFYRWKYFGNPLGDAIVGINAAADTVVSVVAATPKHIWPSGKTVLAYELGDFLTDEDYRGMGLFSKLIELVCREAGVGGSSLVYVRPNDVSFPILAGKLSFHEAQIDARRFGSAEPYLISQDWHSCRPSSSFKHGLASQKTLHPAHPWKCSDRGSGGAIWRRHRPALAKSISRLRLCPGAGQQLLELALLRLATRPGSRSGTARRWVSW